MAILVCLTYILAIVLYTWQLQSRFIPRIYAHLWPFNLIYSCFMYVYFTCIDCVFVHGLCMFVYVCHSMYTCQPHILSQKKNLSIDLTTTLAGTLNSILQSKVKILVLFYGLCGSTLQVLCFDFELKVTIPV